MGEIDVAGERETTSRPRLVRSRSGRYVEEPGRAKPVARGALQDPSARVALLVLGLGALFLVVVLLLASQGEVGSGGPLESVLRDFGYVIREVRGPGLVR